MPRPKALLKNISITQAKRAHNCRSNSNHRIQMNEFRLTMKEGRKVQHYCLDCARRFIDAASEELSSLREKINSL